MDKTTLTLTAGGATGTITATVLPADATNKTVTWTSSDEAVATVSAGVVTPLTAGTTTITATTVDGSFTATTLVTVEAAAVDKTALTAAIAAANTNKDSVTVSTDGTDIPTTDQWVTAAVMTDYTTAIATAQGVADDGTADQATVDAAVTTLATATTTFDSAKAAGTLAADKTALTAAINAEYSDGASRTTYALTEADYTGATWTAYTTAITNAIAVEADGTANQTEVNAAAAAIGTAEGNLVFAGQADLDTAVAAAGALTEADYTVASWADLTAALALPETTNAEVVAKTTAINSAIENLQLILSYNGPVTGQITADGSGLVNGALNFKGTNDLVIVGQVTGTGNLTTFSGTVSGSINGTITAQINANGIDTLSGTITPSSGVVDGTIRIIGVFGQTGIDGDFEGEIITGPVPTYVETLEITSAAGSTVTVGHTLQLGINVTPEAASAEVAWSVYVNDREKGSIDENGLFTATAEGTVTVIAKALDGSLKDDTYVVTVQTLETEAIAAINAGEATLQDYENAGIIGLSAGNLTDVNTAVATAKATKGSDLIKEEIQGVVASVVDAADQLLLARVNASQLRITLENGAVDTIGDMLTEYFGLDAIGESLTETISLFWFDNYHYQDKFTFASLEAVETALLAVEDKYAKIINTFQGSDGEKYDNNVLAVESYLASAARLAATSSSPGRTVADEIVELAPMYEAGIIGADNLITAGYVVTMNNIYSSEIDTLAEFLAAFQAALVAPGD